MAKRIPKIIWIALTIILVCLLLGRGKLFKPFMGVTPSTTVTRQITAGLPGDPVIVKLNLIGGFGKFGGIIGETIPDGFAVTALGNLSGTPPMVGTEVYIVDENGNIIFNLSLGPSGSAFGKLTGNLYEIAFIVDNMENPYIQYFLSSPSTPGAYPLTGTFAYAEDGPTGITGGDNTIYLCIPTCTRPVDLCIESSMILNSCNNGYCTGQWTVTKNSEADTNCDNKVSNLELLVAITKWVNDIPPFNDNMILLSAINSWVNS